MDYLVSPVPGRPDQLRASTPAVPQRAGRFAETPGVRALRSVFHVLCRLAPTLAARIGYTLLARPPASVESRWQVALRGKARNSRLRFGAGELALYEWGSGPVVLLVHGWGSRATHLGKMVGPLVHAGFRVVGFDAPAHGASPGRTTDLVEFAAAVAEVARHVGTLRCVVAHSFGASMALYAQRDWGIAADKLVLISSFDDCKWFTEVFARSVGLSPAVVEAVRAKLVERYSGRLNWSRMSVADMLRQADVPALVIHDEEDPEIPFQHGLAIARASSRAQLHATRGCGHHRVLRRNDVIERIVQFVAG